MRDGLAFFPLAFSFLTLEAEEELPSITYCYNKHIMLGEIE